MNRYIFLLICTIPFFVRAQEKVVIHDALAQERQLPAFSSLSVSHSIQVYLSPGERQTVVVSAADVESREGIVTEVVNGMLKVSYLSTGRGKRYPSALKLYISCPSLDKILLSGASSLFVNGILKGDQLTVELSGASDLKGAVEYKTLALRQSGSADITLSGRADAINVSVSGASDLKGIDLQVDVAEVEVSGASRVRLSVQKELSANISGASDMRYRGSPTVKKMNISGMSSLRKEQ